MKSNFDFLQTEFPVLSTFGCQAEKYCFSDPNSCLMKLGMIGESIVNLMFTYDRIQLPYDNTAVTRIDTLQIALNISATSHQAHRITSLQAISCL